MDVEADHKEVYLGTYDFVEKQVERDENLPLFSNGCATNSTSRWRPEKCFWCWIVATVGISGMVDLIRT